MEYSRQFDRRVAQLAEHSVYTARVAGSNPVPPTTNFEKRIDPIGYLDRKIKRYRAIHGVYPDKVEVSVLVFDKLIEGIVNKSRLTHSDLWETITFKGVPIVPKY